jgi:spore coat protein A
MKKVNNIFRPNRRQVLKAGFVAGVGMAVPWRFLPAKAFARSAMRGLSDPAKQPKFVEIVPDALSDVFIFKPNATTGEYDVTIGGTTHYTGLVDRRGNRLSTPIWGYGVDDELGFTWPGRTFEITKGSSTTIVNWLNRLTADDKLLPHLLPVDTNLHWCYSLHGYTQNSIDSNGVPIITHLHGGHTDYQFDGNPEFFYSPGGPGQRVVGPQWDNVPGGFTSKFEYDDNVQAGCLWYHDHALGITRLNVYTGLAGFYIIRDEWDTGDMENKLGLPYGDYEKAYAIQDRMFWDTGELFYPAYPGEPYYDDFITGEGAILPEELFIDGGPSALAEFFGDHMVVNGMIWPKEDVEPRNYRLRLLNGTDSRFMAIRFRQVGQGKTDLKKAGPPLPFWVIGSDQGLAKQATLIEPDGLGNGGYLLFEPGSRYDVIFDFQGMQGSRIIMENIGGDEPFGGDIPGPQIFGETNRVMAFDVNQTLIGSISDSFSRAKFVKIQDSRFIVNTAAVDRIRKVALFEGKDEFGRLQPLLGTAEPATDFKGKPVNWPDTEVYSRVGLIGQMEGSVAWHSPTTENPKQRDTEEWEIWNVTGDAHPVHLHLVNFEILDRRWLKWDGHVDEDGFIPEGVTPADNGIYLIMQPTVQHNSDPLKRETYGRGFKIVHPPDKPDGTNPAYGAPVDELELEGYVENAPKDMVTALPSQITRIKATFDKPGRYVGHCHILSHEDHEMMRVMHVGPGA